ncbi:HYR domain-containing protein [Solirubrobacter soli]|uniref:HYR domain-containing protein n=1 Tax=Solirubrobacter soli TaxID=363832 RepID=UPI000416077C|nr:HYR domain-containing protein [Solirubrobacter soli]
MVIRTLLSLPLLLIVLLLFTGSADAAKLDAPWTGAGSGSAKVVSNGVAADPQFDYSVVSTGAWTFTNVAATARQVPMAYDYSGFHSWFNVRVKLVAFVSRGGSDVWTKSIVDAGPVNCCTAPSGGFSYKGQTSFDVKAGDVYGFRISGSNGDSDPTVRGSLKLQEVDSTPPTVTPVVTGTQVAGGVYVGPVDVSWTVTDPDSRILSPPCPTTTVAAGEAKTVTCKATSRGGDTTKSVTIARDNDAPSLTVPSAVVKQAAGAAGSAVVTYDATATDAIDPAPVVSCAPASGSSLPLGTTTVTCTATDASGNSATKSFDAIVFPGTAPSTQPSVNPSSGTPTPAPAAKAINAVLAFRFTISKKTTRLVQLKVKNLPKGATVTVTCKGGSCPKKLRGSGSVLTSKGSSLSLSTLVHANLKGGTTINIAISASGALTTIKSLAVRKGKAPVVNTCTASGTKPVAC